MGKTYLLDTNAISKGLRGLLPPTGLALLADIVGREANFSVIIRIELLGFKPDDVRTEEAFHLFIEMGNEIGLSEAIIRKTIEIRRKIKVKLPDAIIAATAITHKMTLISDNDGDFLRIPKLKYLNPAQLK